MSEETVLSALRTLLNTSAFTGGNPPLIRAVFTDKMPSPYAGPYPIAFVQPGTQRSNYVSYGAYQQEGFYTVLYLDLLADQSAETVQQIMQNARQLALVLRQQIRNDYTLGGAVMTAGEGRGIITHYSIAGQVNQVSGQPLYGIPIDIDVVDKPDSFQ